ncbi:hypothetical protein ACFE04_000337 [Oxalis oulophora]
MTLITVLFSLLLVASVNVYLSEGVTKTIISKICSKSSHPIACKDLLNSDSRTSSSDLKHLSLIPIELSQKQADYNLKSYTDLYYNATDEVKEESFRQCLGRYYGIEFNLVEARKLSTQQKYLRAGPMLMKAQSLAAECAYANSVSPPSIFPKIHRDMLLRAETSVIINTYISKVNTY